MLTSLLLTTSVLAQPSVDLSCVLQEGAAWNEGARNVSAVVCNDRSGFFVPSSEFRAMRRPQDSQVYKLLERELAIADKEIESLNKSIAAGDEALQKWKGIADHNETNWRAAENDVQEMRDDVAEAAERSWYESPLLWMGIGAGVVGLIWAVSSGKPDPAVVVATGSGSGLRR